MSGVEVIPTTVIKTRVNLKNDSNNESIMSVSEEVDDVHDITQNIMNVSTDIQSTFTTINNQERNLKMSTVYGNIRELNCRTAYLSTDIIADDGYIDSQFKTIQDIANEIITPEIIDEIAAKVATDEFVSKDDLAASITTNALTVNGDVSISGDVSGGSFSNSSDVRLKENVEKLNDEESKELLDKVEVYKFNFKNDDEKRKHYGVLAQEVKEFAPELVRSGDDEMMSVNYVELIPHLINYVKMLENRINELEKKKL